MPLETSCKNNQGVAFIKKSKSGDISWQFWQSMSWKDQNRTLSSSCNLL